MSKTSYHHGDLKNALIQAGLEILAEEGVESLSLRKVAGRAGVSHSAPYAHFADKQALIAAISTEGARTLYDQLAAAMAATIDPASSLVEVAWTYVQFAQENRACFKIMFSGLLENEHAYPEFVAISHQSFAQIEQFVARWQQAGVLRPGPADGVALSLWSLVHGFVSLLLDGQISSSILERAGLKELLCQTLNQITRVELSPVY